MDDLQEELLFILCMSHQPLPVLEMERKLASVKRFFLLADIHEALNTMEKEGLIARLKKGKWMYTITGQGTAALQLEWNLTGKVFAANE